MVIWLAVMPGAEALGPLLEDDAQAVNAKIAPTVSANARPCREIRELAAMFRLLTILGTVPSTGRTPI
jgi:hypothetical protein